MWMAPRAGCLDLCAGAALIVEWPERIGGYLPRRPLALHIGGAGTASRRLSPMEAQLGMDGSQQRPQLCPGHVRSLCTATSSFITQTWSSANLPPRWRSPALHGAAIQI